MDSDSPVALPPSTDESGVNTDPLPAIEDAKKVYEPEVAEAASDTDVPNEELALIIYDEKLAQEQIQAAIKDPEITKPEAEAMSKTAELEDSAQAAKDAGQAVPKVGPDVYADSKQLNKFITSIRRIIPTRVNKNVFKDIEDVKKAVITGALNLDTLLKREKEQRLAASGFLKELKEKVGTKTITKTSKKGRDHTKTVLAWEKDSEGKVQYENYGPEIKTLIDERKKALYTASQCRELVQGIALIMQGFNKGTKQYRQNSNYPRLKKELEKINKLHNSMTKATGMYLTRKEKRLTAPPKENGASQEQSRKRRRLKEEFQPSGPHFLAHVVLQRMQDEYGLETQMRSMDLGQDRTVRAGRAVNLEKPAWMARLGM